MQFPMFDVCWASTVPDMSDWSHTQWNVHEQLSLQNVYKGWWLFPMHITLLRLPKLNSLYLMHHDIRLYVGWWFLLHAWTDLSSQVLCPTEQQELFAELSCRVFQKLDNQDMCNIMPSRQLHID